MLYVLSILNLYLFDIDFYFLDGQEQSGDIKYCIKSSCHITAVFK